VGGGLSFSYAVSAVRRGAGADLKSRTGAP
jgi:hypothetical protein